MSRPRVRAHRSLTPRERKLRYRLKLTQRGEVRVELQLPRRLVAVIDKAAVSAARSRTQELAALIAEALVTRAKASQAQRDATST